MTLPWSWNKTAGNPVLQSEYLPESPEDIQKEDSHLFAIFMQLRTYDQSTGAGKSEELMNKTNAFIEGSAKERSSYSKYSQITTEKDIESIFPEATQRLQRFAELRENWNGDRGLPPSPETREHAYEVLADLWKMALARKTRPPEPRVTAGAHGDVLFAWSIADRELELGFCVAEGTPTYEYLVCVTSGEVSCEEGSFEGDVVNTPTFKALFSGL